MKRLLSVDPHTQSIHAVDYFSGYVILYPQFPVGGRGGRGSEKKRGLFAAESVLSVGDRLLNLWLGRFLICVSEDGETGR